MAWTKAKMVMAASLGVLLVGGSTATLAVKKWEAYQAYRDWRVPGLDSGTVERAVPQVRILPAKYPPAEHNIAQTAINPERWAGIGASVFEIVWAAYLWRPARIVFAGAPPAEKYDFIANLPQGSAEALRAELKKTLGLVARPETREMDVFLLKVQTPNAPGLMPPNSGGGDDWSNEGRYYCDDRALSNTNPPHLGLTRFLEGYFGKPIIDQTGLTQHFSIDLKWDPRSPAGTDAVKQVMLKKLGLVLVPSRESVEVLVVERAK